MLSLLQSRECGLDPADLLSKAESTRRTFALDLSRHVDVQKMHNGAVNCLHIDSTENRYMLSGAADGRIALYDLHNLTDVPHCTVSSVCTVGRSNPGCHKYSVETVSWYPLDTGMFISSGMDKKLKIWDTNTLTAADEYNFKGVVYNHDMSDVATNHNLIAVACQSTTIQLIDLKSGSSTHSLNKHRLPVLCAKWSTKDEYILASGGQDNKLMLWDIRSSRGALLELDQHNGDSTAGPNSVSTAHNGHVNSLCFTPDGLNLLSFGTDERVRLWDAVTGRNTLVNYGTIDNESRKSVRMCVTENCCPDMVFVPADSNIEVYSMHSGEKLKTLRGHYNQVNCCVYHSPTQELFSGANDRNILVWAPETETIYAYEDHLREKSKEKAGATKQPNFAQRVGTMDTWSDEDE